MCVCELLLAYTGVEGKESKRENVNNQREGDGELTLIKMNCRNEMRQLPRAGWFSVSLVYKGVLVYIV